MKKVVYIFAFLSFLMTQKIFAGTVDNIQTNIKQEISEEKENFVSHPEQFIHINKDCTLCMVSRSANAGCIIPKGDRILLVKDKHSEKFEIPSGKKSIKEPAFATAVRKTLENTGLIVYIDDFISEFSSGFRLYKCKIIDENVDEKRQHLELKWVNKNELATLLKKENRKKKLRFPNELDLIYSKFEWILK